MPTAVHHDTPYGKNELVARTSAQLSHRHLQPLHVLLACGIKSESELKKIENEALFRFVGLCEL